MTREFVAAVLTDLDGLTGTMRVVGNQVLFDAGETVYLLDPIFTRSGRGGRGNGVSSEIVKQWVAYRKAGKSFPEIAHLSGYSEMTVWHKVKAALASETETEVAQ